jgi:methionyl-tRNA formyltransferase
MRVLPIFLNATIDVMRTVFMGSPEFGLPCLRKLAELSEVAGAVTQPDRPSGRGRRLTSPPVKELAIQLGIPVIQPEKISLPDAMAQLRDWTPDLIVVAAFGQILRQDVLTLPRYGCINLHASLLPKHRGAAPIPAAILAGDTMTGVTLMKMDPGLDTGPILGQQALPILPTDTTSVLLRKLAILAAETLDKFLPVYIRGELVPQPQENRLATYAPQLKKEDGRLDFSQNALLLERKVRAYNPWPGAFLLWRGQPLRILEARVEPAQSKTAPGKFTSFGRLPAVQTGEGLLVLVTVQPPGRRPMPGEAFLSGARNFLDEMAE